MGPRIPPRISHSYRYAPLRIPAPTPPRKTTMRLRNILLLGLIEQATALCVWPCCGQPVSSGESEDDQKVDDPLPNGDVVTETHANACSASAERLEKLERRKPRNAVAKAVEEATAQHGRDYALPEDLAKIVAKFEETHKLKVTWEKFPWKTWVECRDRYIDMSELKPPIGIYLKKVHGEISSLTEEQLVQSPYYDDTQGWYEHEDNENRMHKWCIFWRKGHTYSSGSVFYPGWMFTCWAGKDHGAWVSYCAQLETSADESKKLFSDVPITFGGQAGFLGSSLDVVKSDPFMS